MNYIFLIMVFLFLTSCSKEITDTKGMYIIGGSTAFSKQTDKVQIINFEKGEVRYADWNLPIAMENAGVSIINSTLYVFQGLGYDTKLGEPEEYVYFQGKQYIKHDPGKNAPLNINFKVDLTTSNITYLPNYNTSYGEGGAVERIGDCIYKVGATGDFGDNHCYNLSSNSWTELTQYPRGREMGVHGVTPEGNLLVCGGNYKGNETKRCFEYNPSLNNWTERESLPSQLILPAYTQEGDTLHIVGGVLDTVNIYNTTYYILTNIYIQYHLNNYTVSYHTSFPKLIQSAVAGFYKNKLYIVGGTSDELTHYGNGSNEIWSYYNNSWTLEPYELLTPVAIPARDNNLVIE